MKKLFNKYIIIGLSCIGVFFILLILLLTADKKVNGEGLIGLYGFNKAFIVEQYNGNWDSVSDVILLVSLGFLAGVALYGLCQLASKKSLFKVDKDILLVAGGVLFLIVLWVLFDNLFIVNCRPTISGSADESSFPSTHVMLSTFILLSSGYCITKRESKKLIYTIMSYTGFSIMILICILGRILSSMHWMTDVLGGFLIGFGLFSLVIGFDKRIALKEKIRCLDRPLKIVDLTEEQVEELETALDCNDKSYIQYKLNGTVSIGIMDNDVLVAGLDACITAFKILYVSTVYVDEKYRRKGYGKMLIDEMERRAKFLGVNTIRLDTFNWQGKEFYLAMGYEQVGCYKNDIDHFEEYFFLKRI